MDTGLDKRKTPKAFRLSDDGEELLTELARRLGVKQTAVIELALRRMASAEGVELRKAPVAA
jgi:predicted transcriptional regulator